MHQPLHGLREESVVDEVILCDAELRVPPLQVARAVILHAMPQNQILRASWRSDRIRLHEPHLVERAFQRRRLEEAVVDGKSAQVLKADRHESFYSLSVFVG